MSFYYPNRRPQMIDLRSLGAGLAVAAVTLASLAPAHARGMGSKPSVAVLYFDYTGKNAELFVLKKGMAQMLISDLKPSLPCCDLVERDRLEEILKELKLSQSKHLDSKTAAKMGKLIGAQYLVMGSYFDLLGWFRIDARVVAVETGAIIGSVGEAGSADEFIKLERALARGLVAILKKMNSPKAKKRKTPPRRIRKDKRPRKKGRELKVATLLKYSKALEAKDRGDKPAAVKQLKKLVGSHPHFKQALIDLNSLVQ